MLTAVVKGKNCKTVAIVILLGLPEPIKSNLMVCAVDLADKGIHIQFKAHSSWHLHTEVCFVNVPWKINQSYVQRTTQATPNEAIADETEKVTCRLLRANLRLVQPTILAKVGYPENQYLKYKKGS